MLIPARAGASSWSMMHLAFAAELHTLRFGGRRCSAVGPTCPDCNCFTTLPTLRISEAILSRARPPTLERRATHSQIVTVRCTHLALTALGFNELRLHPLLRRQRCRYKD
jgi:hypothetical protein